MFPQDLCGVSISRCHQTMGVHTVQARLLLPGVHSGQAGLQMCPRPSSQCNIARIGANSQPPAVRHAAVRRATWHFLRGSATGMGSSSSSAFMDATGGLSGMVLCRPGWAHNRREGHGGRRRTLVVRAAVFDQLATSLEKVWTKLSTETKLTQENIKEPMQEIRRALLEADVSLPVVRRFVKTVSEKAVGTDVVRGVKPDQQLVKVVNDELVGVMGGKVAEVEFARTGPTVILMAGLQGVGKTTACGKLALYLKKKDKRCLLVATDVYRPAAIDQLITLGQQVDVPVFSLGTEVKPPEIARRSLAEAKRIKADVVIVDTAGRLQVDGVMMEELRQTKSAVNPTEVLLVVDAMTGQEAAGLVAAFHRDVGITGAILTKVDGDSRGGAALSVYEVSGRPIKFVGEGEAMTALEPFYPERMAQRILGMGDVLTLVEKAQEAMAQEDALSMTRRVMEDKYDFEDLLKQTGTIAKMGSLGGLTKLIPGMNKVTPQQIKEAEKSFRVMESMIKSMTPKERKDPSLLAKCPSRRKRIALGSGRSPEQVSALVSQLYAMRTQMKALLSTMPGMAPPGGPLKASPGKAKRKKSRGFGAMLEAAKK